MKITGMEQINRKRRKQSKKTASKFSREKKKPIEKSRNSSRKHYFEGKKLKDYYILIISLFILVVGYLLFTNWNEINKVVAALQIENPVLTEVISNEKKYDDGVERVMVVTTRYSAQRDVDIEKVYTLSHNREKGIRSIVHLPGEIHIPLSYREFGDRSSVSNLFYAGETISSELGLTYTIWEIENLLGVSFDSYIWLQPEATEMFKEDTSVSDDESSDRYLKKLLSISNPVNLLLHRSDITSMSDFIYSDLDGRSIMNVLSTYNFSGFDDLEYLDLGDGKLTEMETITSGDEVPFLSYPELDPVLVALGQELASKNIEREQAKVEIYNGSDISGQASRYSRNIANNGVKVVRVDNTDVEFGKTTVYAPLKDEYDATLSLILSFFGNEPVVKEQRPDFLTTADLIIVLGQDLEDDVNWLPDL